MYNTKMIALGETRSAIRELTAYGEQLAKKLGKDNVFDFTIGNPSVPTPQRVNDTITQNLTNPSVHSYTSQQGLLQARQAIARHNKEKYGINISAEHIYLTCGASAALAITLRAVVTESQDEVVVITPYFPEYKVFTENAGGKIVVVPAESQNFQIDFAALENALSPRTAAVIVNTPNNPSGVVYTSDTLKKLAQLLTDKEKQFGNVIVLISDEPYREIVFDVAFDSPVNYYADSVLCYSYSKTFSLAGERIGYVALPDTVTQCDKLYSAIMGAGRALGYVCAPSLFQQVVADCCNLPANALPYKENRDFLVSALTKLGYRVVNPQGAFYILMQLPKGDFLQLAKRHGILIVPTDTFGLPNYARIATCVSKDMILRSLPVWERVTKEFFGK